MASLRCSTGHAERLPLYIDLGLNLSKLGEEARVPLESFSLEGAARADLPPDTPRAGRDGATFEMVARRDVPPILPDLRAVSDAWLQAKNTAEKRFSLGISTSATSRISTSAWSVTRERSLPSPTCGAAARANCRWISCATTTLRRKAWSISCSSSACCGVEPRFSLVQSRDGAALGFGGARIGSGVHKLGRWCSATEKRFTLRGLAQIQGEIRSGVAPSISGGAGWFCHGGRLARRDCH